MFARSGSKTVKPQCNVALRRRSDDEYSKKAAKAAGDGEATPGGRVKYISNYISK
jgi:hypothetical protein